MKNHPISLLLFVAITAAILSSASLAKADDESAMKVGKNAEVTFNSETRVGDVTLPPGRYRLAHRVEVSEHFIQFTALSARNPYYRTPARATGYPGEVKCKVELMAKAPSATRIYKTKENGVAVITRVEIAGENVAHLFNIAALF